LQYNGSDIDIESVSAEKQRKRFSEFVAAEWHRLVSYVRSLLDDSEDRDAEDIVQDVLVGIFENADVTAPILDLGGYVYRALHNRIVDAYRRKKRTVPLEDDPRSDGEGLLDVLKDLRFEAATEAEKTELRNEIFSAIEALPEDQSGVLVATEMEGRKFRELSEEWGVPIGTLLARKHRAVVRLRETLSHHRNQGGLT
jgi:RNA polymerase sigma factor (sigma-70 family)